jgi:5,10-methylenetetrahydromethanopterin reductase
MTRFSLTLGADPHRPVSYTVELAKAAESAGFDGFYLWDSWFVNDAYVALTAAALSTERIMLGPGVAPLQIRHPVMLANAMASLDDVSDGRALLTVGSGGNATISRLGLKTTKIKDFVATVNQLRTLLAGDSIVDGTANYRAEAVRRPLPIHAAVWGPRMQEAAGQIADGAFIMGPEQQHVFEDKIACIKSAAKEAGRNPEDVKIALNVTCLAADDLAPIVDEFRTLAVHNIHRVRYEYEYPERFLPLFRKVREMNGIVPYPAGGEVCGEHLITEELVKYMLIVGSEREVQDRVEQLLTLDVDELTFQLNYGSVEMVRNLTTLVERVA